MIKNIEKPAFIRAQKAAKQRLLKAHENLERAEVEVREAQKNCCKYKVRPHLDLFDIEIEND